MRCSSALRSIARAFLLNLRVHQSDLAHCDSRLSMRAISDSATRRNRERSAAVSTCASISVAMRIDASGFLNSCDTSDANASVDS